MQLLKIYIVIDMGGKFVAAFGTEESARVYILSSPGKFNSYDVADAEVEIE